MAQETGEQAEISALNRNTLYANNSLSLAIGLPAAWFSSTAVNLFFGWGSLEQPALATIASLATISLATLPLQGMVGYFLAALNAARRTEITVIVSLVCIALFLLVAFPLKAQFGLLGVVIALSVTYVASWIVFSVFSITLGGWALADCGFSRATLMLLGLNGGIAALFIFLSWLMPESALQHVVFGSLWCAASLFASLRLHQRL
ncbi:MAG: hypothetical protein ACR2O4_06790 [Hyphomicrobiaceae bacterium]